MQKSLMTVCFALTLIGLSGCYGHGVLEPIRSGKSDTPAFKEQAAPKADAAKPETPAPAPKEAAAYAEKCAPKK